MSEPSPSGAAPSPRDLRMIPLIVGCALMAGTWVGKAFVLRLPERMFQRLLDGLMLLSGATLLTALWE